MKNEEIIVPNGLRPPKKAAEIPSKPIEGKLAGFDILYKSPNDTDFSTQLTTQVVYSHPLKTLYRQGKLPVKYGFYGDKLTQKNVSLEHLKPHSKGGKTELSNLVLASKQKNQARGNADIRNFANKETIIKYLSQFIDVKIKDFDGNKYINGIIKTLRNLGVIK